MPVRIQGRLEDKVAAISVPRGALLSFLQPVLLILLPILLPPLTLQTMEWFKAPYTCYEENSLFL